MSACISLGTEFLCMHYACVHMSQCMCVATYLNKLSIATSQRTRTYSKEYQLSFWQQQQKNGHIFIAPLPIPSQQCSQQCSHPPPSSHILPHSSLSTSVVCTVESLIYSCAQNASLQHTINPTIWLCCLGAYLSTYILYKYTRYGAAHTDTNRHTKTHSHTHRQGRSMHWH